MKNISKLSIIPVSIFLLWSVSCKKYVNPPSITLNGENVVESDLNASYVDEGAVAENYKGKDISGDITSVGSVDQDLVGDYMIYYDVTDKKGHNAVTVNRIIQVRNSADYLDGFYNVSYDVITGTSTNSTGTTIDEVEASNTINNRFYLRSPAALYASVDGSVVTVPIQGDISIGQWQGSGTIDANGNMVVDVDFLSPGESYSFSMEYTKH
jgi:hypothetical protein